MKKLVWNFSSKPGTLKHASTTFPSIHEDWRLPTTSELIFAIQNGVSGFGQEARLYWVREDKIMDQMSAVPVVLFPTGVVFKSFTDEIHCICHVRDPAR